MKLYSIIFLLSIIVSPLYLYPMEKQEKLSKQVVRINLQELTSLFNNHKAELGITISQEVEKTITELTQELSLPKIRKKKLQDINKRVRNTGAAINESIKNTRNLLEICESTHQTRITVPIPSQPPKQPTIQFPTMQNYPSPQRLSTTITSFFTQQSPNNQEPIRATDGQTSWRRMIAYFSTAGLFTGFSLYSYYKLQPEQWYRPIFIGLGCLGTFGFGCLGYRDWKLSKRFESM